MFLYFLCLLEGSEQLNCSSSGSCDNSNSVNEYANLFLCNVAFGWFVFPLMGGVVVRTELQNELCRAFLYEGWWGFVCFCLPSLVKSFGPCFVFTYSLSLHQKLTSCHSCTDEGQDVANIAKLCLPSMAFMVDFLSAWSKLVKFSSPVSHFRNFRNNRMFISSTRVETSMLLWT